MDKPCGEPPSERVLKEFRLWRAALAKHGHVLPGEPPVDETPFLPGRAAESALPPATDPPGDERGARRRRRWLATVFVGALVPAILAAGYRHSNIRQTPINRLAEASPAAASLPATAPLNEADRRRVELADHVTHAGEALAMSGDAAGALRLYRQSLSIRRELAAHSPGDTTVQRALADNWDKVADSLAAQRDTARSLGAYREAEAVWEKCARALPGDSDVQRRRSLTALSLGNLLLAREDPAGAVEAFGRGVFIQETLCRQEPDNVAWQEDLALGWLRLGDAFDQRADDEAALQACRHALAIDETLVQRQATNLAWQGDLATARGKVGDLLLARNEVDLALREYTAAASRREQLAAADSNPERRRALAEAQDRIGQALEVKKQSAAALPFYQQALRLVAELTTESPENQGLETLQAAICFRLGRATANCRPVDPQAARAALRGAHDRLASLKSADGTYPDKEQAEMLAAVERLLAELDDQPATR